jgi:shikimate dehydrogenase
LKASPPPLRIDGSTGLCCLIGNPVRHSISPQMHNAAFQALNLNLVYLAFQVEDGLGEAVKGLRSLGVKGFNVTIPYKVSVMDHLDALDDSALRIGAVNTVLNRDGTLIGYNTDGRGFIRSIGIENIKDRGLTVLGAGGAARAIVYESARYASRIFILNRTLSRAEALAEEVASRLGLSLDTEIEAMPLNPGSLRKALEHSSLLANATPIGMYPRVDESPVPEGLLRRDLTVFDAVYNPLETRLLREARLIGATTVNGLEMLIHQGGEAFKIWTGLDPPIEAMRSAALKALRGHGRPRGAWRVKP